MEKDKLSDQKPKVLTLVIFFVTLAIVSITLITVFFPAFLLVSIGGFQNYTNINPFETGIWTYPLLVTNTIVFVIATLYFKNKLPSQITKSIAFIFNFEISAQIAFVVVTVILGMYIVFTVQEIFIIEPWEDYYLGVKAEVTKSPFVHISSISNLDLRYFLLSSSFSIFGDDGVIPFIASVSLLLLIYFITIELTKKRFSGIIAMAIVLQSNVFLTYDTTPSYTNFWVLFYLLSLYLICKRWYLSPISYLVSIFTKTLTAVFFPMTFFFIYNSDISKQKKIRSSISYGATVAILIAGFFYLGTPFELREFSYHDFLAGFTYLSFGLRYDGLVLVLLLPLTIGLFFASRKGILHADSIMVLISGILLLSPLLLAITYYTNQPYRFLPLIVFFAIGIGTLFSKTNVKVVL